MFTKSIPNSSETDGAKIAALKIKAGCQFTKVRFTSNVFLKRRLARELNKTLSELHQLDQSLPDKIDVERVCSHLSNESGPAVVCPTRSP